MIEFFITLFGAIYYGGRYFSDKKGFAEAKQKMEERSKRVSTIYDYVFNSIESEKMDKSESYREEMLNEISEDLEFIYGKDWRKNFDFPPVGRPHQIYVFHGYSGAIVASPWTLAFNVWLSHFGRINHSSNGYQFRCDHEDVVLRALDVIERNIKEKHPELNARLVEGKELGCQRDIPLLRWEFG